MNAIHSASSLAADLRRALRSLRHNPSFALTAALTLALGIGTNTAIFSVINGILIKPLPYPHAERLVAVWHSFRFNGTPTDQLSLSPRMYAIYANNNRTFEKFGIWRELQASVTGVGDPEQVDSLQVTEGVLPALGVAPEIGRWFSAADDAPDTPETVILTHGYWQRRFAGDRGILGKLVTIDSRPRQVIGVMPRTFAFLTSKAQIILPRRLDPAQLPGSFGHRGIARLKPGATLALANADIRRMLPVWMDTYGENRKIWEDSAVAPALRPLKADVVGNLGSVLWVLMGTVGLVLLMACANVANLLLVRADGRQREFAVCAALGASWSRIASALLAESLVLAAFGGTAGLLIAEASLRLLRYLAPSNLPRLTELSIDTTVLFFTVGVSLLSGLTFGAIPIIKYAGPRIALALRSGGRAFSQGREQRRSQNTLVVVQVALALVLLIGSGLMIRTFQAVRNVKPGFTNPDQVQTVRISIPSSLVEQPERVVQIEHQILDKLAALPGVSSAAFATALPMEIEPEFESTNTIFVEGKQYAQNELAPLRRVKSVSPGLFQTVGTPLVTGRDFTWTDIDGNREVAIVSENVARQEWGQASAALGKHIRDASNGRWREVIGVVGDVYDNGAQEPAVPIVYWPSRAGANPGIRSIGFALRSPRTSTESFLNETRQAVWAVNSNLPLSRVQPLSEVYDGLMARTSFTLVMLAIAGTMALLLGIIGIYGVVSYAVSQRRREIAIRLALGSQQKEIKKLFLHHALMLSGIGVVIGLGAAAWLTRLMTSVLFGVSPLDPLTYAAMPIVLVVAAVIASYAPAQRAVRVDPMSVLRGE